MLEDDILDFLSPVPVLPSPHFETHGIFVAAAEFASYRWGNIYT